jgi:hypothetical protein
MIRATKLRVSPFVARSSGDNGKAVDERLSLQRIKTSVCRLKDLALFRGKQRVGIEGLGYDLYLPGPGREGEQQNKAFVRHA